MPHLVNLLRRSRQLTRERASWQMQPPPQPPTASASVSCSAGTSVGGTDDALPTELRDPPHRWITPPLEVRNGTYDRWICATCNSHVDVPRFRADPPAEQPPMRGILDHVHEWTQTNFGFECMLANCRARISAAQFTANTRTDQRDLSDSLNRIAYQLVQDAPK